MYEDVFEKVSGVSDIVEGMAPAAAVSDLRVEGPASRRFEKRFVSP
ncbi:hypothetical protein ACGFYE_30780 [Streptomyces zaomyceticus]